MCSIKVFDNETMKYGIVSDLFFIYLFFWSEEKLDGSHGDQMIRK